MGIAEKLGLRYHNLSRSARAELIEYWVNKPGTSMKQLGDRFQVSQWTAGRIISRDYFGITENDCSVILRQSKINTPDYELIITD